MNATYQAKVYHEQGGDALKVASGGTIDVESGGVLNLESGAELDIASGGQIDIESGSVINIESGGTIAIAAGGEFDDAGAVRDASIVVGAEAADVRAITIQLKDGQGNDIAVRQTVQIIMLLDANGDAFVVTGGSTGIAIGTDGALLPVVAKKSFHAISEADGDIDLTWTDTGTEVAFLAIVLPNGKMIISDPLTNA